MILNIYALSAAMKCIATHILGYFFIVSIIHMYYWIYIEVLLSFYVKNLPIKWLNISTAHQARLCVELLITDSMFVISLSVFWQFLVWSLKTISRSQSSSILSVVLLTMTDVNRIQNLITFASLIPLANAMISSCNSLFTRISNSNLNHCCREFKTHWLKEPSLEQTNVIILHLL